MIKEVSKKILKKINPEITPIEEKWINVFNEVQNRTNVIFEGLVSWYSLGLFLEHLEYQGLGNLYELYPVRYKTAIYQTYIFIELNNLLDPKGKSSIVSFINFFNKDLNLEKPTVIEVFKSNVNVKKLDVHFKLFNEWLENHKEEVNHIKYMRDKNYGHIDHNFKYDNKISYEIMISMIVFISDFLTSLSVILDFTNLRIIKDEVVSTKVTLQNNTSKKVLEIRFKQEIGYLINNSNFNNDNKQIFLLNCYDSIEETLKRVNLINV